MWQPYSGRCECRRRSHITVALSFQPSWFTIFTQDVPASRLPLTFSCSLCPSPSYSSPLPLAITVLTILHTVGQSRVYQHGWVEVSNILLHAGLTTIPGFHPHISPVSRNLLQSSRGGIPCNLSEAVSSHIKYRNTDIRFHFVFPVALSVCCTSPH